MPCVLPIAPARGLRVAPRVRRRLAFAIAFSAACSPEVTPYPNAEPALRLVPATGSVGRAGGRVILLAQLDVPEASPAAYLTALTARSAAIEPLPGATTCAFVQGGSTTDGSTGAGTDATDGHAAADDGVLLPLSGFVGADAFAAHGPTAGLHETALALLVPAGDDDVLLFGAVYAPAEGTTGDCPERDQLVAFASAIIERDDGATTTSSSSSTTDASSSSSSTTDASSSTSVGEGTSSGSTDTSSTTDGATSDASTSTSTGAAP